MNRLNCLYSSLLTLCLVWSGGLGAAQVSVEFAPGVERYLPRINAIEQNREENFRQTLTSVQSPANSVFTFNRQRLEGTQWAGERLITDIDQYTVENLARKLVEDNLARMGISDNDGSIEIMIDRIRVSNYAIPRIGAANTYVEGTVRWSEAQSASHREEQVTANLVRIPVLDQTYTGPKYAFAEPDENNRIGPVLSQFVEVALARLFPEHADDIHGPVLVKFRTDSGGRLVSR